MYKNEQFRGDDDHFFAYTGEMASKKSRGTRNL